MRNHKACTSYQFWLIACVGYSKGCAPLTDVWNSCVPLCCFFVPHCRHHARFCERFVYFERTFIYKPCMLLSELKKEENFIRQFDSRGFFFVGGGFVRLIREGCGGMNASQERDDEFVCVCMCTQTEFTVLSFFSGAGWRLHLIQLSAVWHKASFCEKAAQVPPQWSRSAASNWWLW